VLGGGVKRHEIYGCAGARPPPPALVRFAAQAHKGRGKKAGIRYDSGTIRACVGRAGQAGFLKGGAGFLKGGVETSYQVWPAER
jgi:hypothetical protein